MDAGRVGGVSQRGREVKISPRGISLIRRHEGLRLKAYRCPAGVLTIGIGHTGPDVTPDMEIDEEEAERLLKSDLASMYDAIGDLVDVDLNQNEFDALCSLVFNIGRQAFKSSTLLRLLNQGQRYPAAQQFGRWVHAGREVLPGLIKRRDDERSLFLELA